MVSFGDAADWRPATKKEVEILSKRMGLIGVFEFFAEWVVFYRLNEVCMRRQLIPYARRFEPLPREKEATYQINKKNVDAYRSQQTEEVLT
jgi:hypothetical protein